MNNKIIAFLNDINETMSYLYSRWQDEMEYENIQDYQNPLKSFFEKHGVTFIKMTKRPFGFRMNMEGTTWNVKCNVRGYNLQLRAEEVR